MAASYRLDWYADRIMANVELAGMAGVDATSQEAANLAASFSPVDTGFLRDNWFIISAQRVGMLIIGGISNRAPYWIFIELGTRRMRAYLPGRRALDIAAAGLAQRMTARVAA